MYRGGLPESYTEFPEGSLKESTIHPMKRTFASVVLPMVLLSVTAFAQTGSAAPAAAAATPAPNGPAKIGIINIQQAILLTNEGKRDFESLDKKFEPKRTELQTLSKEVDDLKKQLSTQSDKLN